jgi:tetratricopeptide (TPR) repeat protein
MLTRKDLHRPPRARAIAAAAVAAALVWGCTRGRQTGTTGSPAVASAATGNARPEPPGPPVVGAPAPPSPSETRAAWREGVGLFGKRDYSSAVAPLRTAAAGRPDDASIHYLLGLALWKSGDPEGASGELERSATIDPTSVRTFINLARVRNEGGRFAPALEAADAAIRIRPDSADALHQRGRALLALGRADEALESLTEARRIDSGNGYLANTIGYLLIQRGRPEEALPFLEAARETLPGVAYVRNNLGVVYERLGRRADALAEFRAAVEAGDSEGKGAASLARLDAPLPPPEKPENEATGNAPEPGGEGSKEGTAVAHDVPPGADPQKP